jgi:hypothetical protein
MTIKFRNRAWSIGIWEPDEKLWNAGWRVGWGFKIFGLPVLRYWDNTKGTSHDRP